MSSRWPRIPVMIMCSTASPRSWRCFCIVVFEMTPLPALVWLMMAIPHLFREVFVAFEMAQLLALVWSMMAFPHLFREGHSALPLSLLVSTGQLTVWVRWEGFLPAGGVSSSWTLQILWDTCKVCSFCHDCLALQFDLLCHSSTTTRTTFSYISEKLWVRFLPEIFTLMVALMVWHILHIYDIYVSQFGLAVRR